MERLLAIDPGTTESAFVRLDDGLGPVSFGTMENDALLGWIYESKDVTHLAIEMVASYGKPVGAEVFQTVLWIGRFVEAMTPVGHTLVLRRQVKLHLCGQTVGVNDAVIRQRLIDLYGGKDAAIGKKKSPGPLYGMRADQWQALAVGLTWRETFGGAT